MKKNTEFDFTLNLYNHFLRVLLNNGFNSIFISDFIINNQKKINQTSFIDKKYVVLRHDVDRKPENSFNMAKIENDLGALGVYYFRIVKESYDLRIMEEISKLGHEIGYHYEDVDNALQYFKKNGIKNFSNDDLIDKSFEFFKRNLKIFKKNFDIKTISMHGSPLSRYDNKLMWRKYNYTDFGIICEPYLDIDYSSISYLTDTGRSWGNSPSVRDKVKSNHKHDFKNTIDIIKGINRLSNNVIFTIHPERWTNRPAEWVNSLVTQKVKNIIKSFLLKTNYYESY